MNCFRKGKTLELLATTVLMFLTPVSSVLAMPPGEESGAGGRANIIFDTDMCLDDDDGMALAMVHALHARHEVNLVAVTVNLDEKWCAPYVDVLNTFYGHPDVPIGTIRNGPRFIPTIEKILKGLGLPPPKDKAQLEAFVTFAQFILKEKNPDGSPMYPRRLTDGSQAPDAVAVFRTALAAQPDQSVVVIGVGNSANLAAVLDSRPDAISDLSGPDLIKKKVRFLSIMAGAFQEAKARGFIVPKGAGINIYEDVAAAQKVFNAWPTRIVVSGDEIGEAVRFPAISVERDFSYVANHPIAQAYLYQCARVAKFDNTIKCPFDHHTADPTATLYALRPDRNYFSLSRPGKVTVLDSGNMRFDDDPDGKQFHLIVDERQIRAAEEAISLLVSQPPISSH